MEKVQYKAVNDGVMYCLAFNPANLPTISMAYTTPAWVAEQKEVTRRSWQPSTIRRFQKGTRYLAVSNNYGGTALGIGEITENPFKQRTGNDITLDGMIKFYKAEGFHYLDGQWARINNWKLPKTLSIESMKDFKSLPLIEATHRWMNSNVLMTVVPFKVNEVFPCMKDKFTTDDQIKKSVKALVRAIA